MMLSAFRDVDDLRFTTERGSTADSEWRSPTFGDMGSLELVPTAANQCGEQRGPLGSILVGNTSVRGGSSIEGAVKGRCCAASHGSFAWALVRSASRIAFRLFGGC